MKLHARQQHIIDVYGKAPENLDEIAEATIAVLTQHTRVVGFSWNVSYDRSSSNSHYAPVTGVTNWGGRAGPDVPRGYPAMFGRVWIRYERDPNFMGLSDRFREALSYPGTGGGGAYSGPWDKICHAVYKTKTFEKPNGRGWRKPIYQYPDPDCYSWDYRFFLEDWPELERTVLGESRAFEERQDKQEAWHKLQGKWFQRPSFTFTHQFRWEDPDTLKADEAFLAEFKKGKYPVAS